MEPVATGGRRHKRSAKKLRLVKKKTVRSMLAKQGLKMRGGGEPTGTEVAAAGGGPGPALAPASTGGRRRRHGKTHRRSRKGLFGKMGF